MIELLTKREKEVLSLISKGYKNKEIQNKLSITNKTLRTHISNIQRKYNPESYLYREGEPGASRIKIALLYLKETGQLLVE